MGIRIPCKTAFILKWGPDLHNSSAELIWNLPHRSPWHVLSQLLSLLHNIGNNKQSGDIKYSILVYIKRLYKWLNSAILLQHVYTNWIYTWFCCALLCICYILYPNRSMDLFNSLWLSGAIFIHRMGSTMAQVMTCCLMASSHYLNQCWLIISKADGLHLWALS